MENVLNEIPDLHVESEQTLLNVLIGESDSLSNCVIHTHWDGLDIIPANLTLYNAEMIIPNQIYQHRQNTGQILPFFSIRTHQSCANLKIQCRFRRLSARSRV